jgi:hypothetical protein
VILPAHCLIYVLLDGYWGSFFHFLGLLGD